MRAALPAGMTAASTPASPASTTAMPMRSRRRRVSCFSFGCDSRCRQMRMVPLVGVSSAAMQCSSVDVSEPNGHITALNCPAVRSSDTPPQRVDLGLTATVGLGEVDGPRGEDGGLGADGLRGERRTHRFVPTGAA